MILGYDLGNRYAKSATEITKQEKTEFLLDEIFIAWKEISLEEYEKTSPSEISETTNKVKYKDLYYIVGDVGEISIGNKNKGSKEVIEHSNMIKLVSIARILKKQSLVEKLDITIVTGTPFDDYEITSDDYRELMLSKGDEMITVDDIEYKIKVTDVDITKQAACVIYTLPERKTTSYAIWDLGGGTLDVSIFENGIRVKGKTLDFELNKIYEELGYAIGKYIEVDRPSMSDARFQKSMEQLAIEGKYKGVESVSRDGKEVKLSEKVHEFMKRKFNEIVDKASLELGLSQVSLDVYNHVFVGGGAKSLKKEITSNSRLKNKSIQENSPFSNAKSYYKIGKARA